MRNFRTFIWVFGVAFLSSPIGAHAVLITASDSIQVNDPIAPSGDESVILDANGIDSDVEVNAAITVGSGGNILIEADDGVFSSSEGMLIAPGEGAVTIRADTDGISGDSNDGISIGAPIHADSRTVELFAGGDLSVNADIRGSDLGFHGGGAGSMIVADTISASRSLSVMSFDTLILALFDDLLTSSALIQIDVSNILFDGTGVALSDGLTFQILNAGNLEFLSSPSFAFTGLSSGFELDTANFLGEGFVTARMLGPVSVPEPSTLALLGLGLIGMAARRRKTV